MEKSNLSFLLDTQVFYVALDELQFPLGDSDFTQKWTLLTWPAKIEKQMERTVKVLAADNERYQKEMEGEQALFANTMESLDTVVNNFAQFTDLANVLYIFLRTHHNGDLFLQCISFIL